jgi:hypothetical protein
VINSLVCNEIFVTTALRHSTPPVLHIARIPMAFCCDKHKVTCCTLCRQGSSAVWPHADLFNRSLIFSYLPLPSPPPPPHRYTGISKFPIGRIGIIFTIIYDVIKLLCKVFGIECVYVCSCRTLYHHRLREVGAGSHSGSICCLYGL